MVAVKQNSVTRRFLIINISPYKNHYYNFKPCFCNIMQKSESSNGSVLILKI
jgi:hypothetical protein